MATHLDALQAAENLTETSDQKVLNLYDKFKYAIRRKAKISLQKNIHQRYRSEPSLRPIKSETKNTERVRNISFHVKA